MIQLGEYLEAEIEWDQHNAHKNLGLALKGQGCYPEAAASFRDSIKIWPADRRAYDQLQELMDIHPDLGKTHSEYWDFLDKSEVVVENANLIGRTIHQEGGDTSSLPIPLRILLAAVIVVTETGRKVFTPEELRGRIGVDRKIWDLIFAPLLREMSNGRNEADGDELKNFRGVFQMESVTELRFTERGAGMAELVIGLIKG